MNDLSNEMEILNPDIKEVLVGVRKLRKIQLYPLSVVDQFKVTDLFQEALGAFLVTKNMDNTQLIALFIHVFKSNLPKVLSLVIDPEEDIDTLLAEITNNQLSDIVTIIYKSNYEVISKNVGGLLKNLPQMKKESPLERPSPLSVKSMDINSEISSENPGKMGE
jgi:hypothetical protein